MSGLPIVDELYFEAPSIRLGGWLAFQMQKSGLPFASFVAGESPFVSIPLKQCDTLADALSEIEAEDRQQPYGTYYYRGQTSRYYLQCPCHIPRLAQSFPHLGSPTFKFESFLPSAFRGYVTRPDGATPIVRWPSWSMRSPLADVGPVARALMQSPHEELRQFVSQYFLDAARHREIPLARALATGPLTISNRTPASLLAPGTNVLKSLLTLISWAQHYEFGSVMVDISSSPRVAAWFASHRWSGEVVNDADGVGVLYRFNYGTILHFLEKELDRETKSAQRIRALGFLGLTDISTLPSTVGKRPAAQHGGSFLGLENIVVAYLFSIYQGLEIFTFPLRSVTGEESGYNKPDLCTAPQN